MKQLDAAVNEVDKNRLAGQLAVSYISQHPLQTLKRTPLKWYYLFHHGNEGFYWLKMGASNISEVNWRLMSLAGQGGYLLLLILAIAGIIKLIFFQQKVPIQSRQLFLFFLLSLLIYGLFFGYSRYHFPLIPFLVMFAGNLLVRRK